MPPKSLAERQAEMKARIAAAQVAPKSAAVPPLSVPSVSPAPSQPAPAHTVSAGYLTRCWDRQALYEQVWATPMQTLAKQYGISDVGLAKICRKLSIPLPGRGYWARKAAGETMATAPLPAVQEVPLILKPEPKAPEPDLVEIATEEQLARLTEIANSPATLFFSAKALRHPLIVATRSALKPRSAVEPRTHEGRLDIRVSKGSLSRALQIMAALIEALTLAGGEVRIDPKERESTSVHLFGEILRFGLVEKERRIELPQSPRTKSGGYEPIYRPKEYKFEPTGTLHVEVWNCWRTRFQKTWSDGKRARLEDRVPECVAGMMKLALEDRATTRKRQAEDRERQRRAEERARLEQQIKEEKARVTALEKAANEWSRAQRIRSFVAAVEAEAKAAGAAGAESNLGRWLKWAAEQADRLDPLAESPASVLDQEIEEPESDYSWPRRERQLVVRLPKPLWKMP